MKSAKPLVIQAIITELLSLGFFGITANLWLVGLLAPVYGVLLPLILAADFGSPIMKQLAIPSAVLLILAAVVVLAAIGKLNRWLGHAALGLFSIGSTLCLLGMK
jgi:hypothetical protein